MTRESITILLGVFVALALFIGLPLWLLQWIFPVVGLIVALVGFSLRKKRFVEENTQSTPAVPTYSPSHSYEGNARGF